jgi:aryl-alcohol dehydrogenase-like predicted oxidoreductase
MIYRYFGNSGLSISAISLGNMINFREENYEIDEQVVRTALRHGINYFDTA